MLYSINGAHHGHDRDRGHHDHVLLKLILLIVSYSWWLNFQDALRPIDVVLSQLWSLQIQRSLSLKKGKGRRWLGTYYCLYFLHLCSWAVQVDHEAIQMISLWSLGRKWSNCLLQGGQAPHKISEQHYENDC